MWWQKVHTDHPHHPNTRLPYTLQLQNVLEAVSLTLPHVDENIPAALGKACTLAPHHAGNVGCVIISSQGAESVARPICAQGRLSGVPRGRLSGVPRDRLSGVP